MTPVTHALTSHRSWSLQSRGTRRNLGDLAMAVPAIVWYLIFMIGPLASVFYISLLDWPGLISPSRYTGFDNFARLAQDEVFWAAVRNTVVQMGLGLPVITVCGFMLGYYLTLGPRGLTLLRIALFTPALISLSARAMIFLAVLSPNGLINGVLGAAGGGRWTHAWLAEQSTALASVILVDVWAGVGFTAVLFSARLSTVSTEQYEAAYIDGAGHWRRMASIAFPIIKSYFGVLTMLQFLWMLFGSAGSILLLTHGGPGNDSTTLSFMMYDEAFSQAHVGYSQAIGVVLFVVGIAGMIAIRRMFRPSH
jgi:multiple sugar transport system permease protein